jgi:hypothetical protein
MASTALTLAKPAYVQTRQISKREQDIVRETMQEFSQYQIWRSAHAAQCEETAALILPTSRNTFFYQNFNWPGHKKTQQQVDATGALALHRFCAIADSLVTPRNMKWHGLVANNDYVMKDRDTRLWFESSTAKLFKARYASTANFVGQNYSNWQSTGAFGNSTMYVDFFDGRRYGQPKGLRYKAVPFGETFFGENHQGKVDRMLRWFRRTAYQTVQQWGLAALPPGLHSALEQQSQWPYNFLHCVKPRAEDYDPDRFDEKSFPFESYYVSIEGQCLMGPESGYRVFPFAVSRYDQAPNEVYGRGPAQIVLPALKTLNAEKVTYLTAGHRAANPVLLTADDGITDFKMRPGAMNKGAVTPDGKPLVHVLPVGNVQIAKEMMQEEVRLIDDTFLVSLFKVLSEHPDMTATQVIELVNEKGMLVAPTLGRQHAEYVGQMVEREMDLLSQLGILDPMPPRLREARGEYQVTDTSPLALAARTSEAAGFLRTLENVRELVNITQDQSLLDPFDFDIAIPEIAQIQNTPERWMSNPQAMAQKRKARAAQQQRQEQIQSAPAQAAIIKARAVAAKAGMLDQQQPGAPG